MLAFAVVVVQPPLVLFALIIGYAFSGPSLTLFHLRRRRAERKSGASGMDSDDSP